MAKKDATQGEKAATRTAKNQADNRRKALRRRTGDVKRVELQLNADSTRDQYIADHLNALPYGTTSEYVRLAIEEKIAREVAGHEGTAGINSDHYEDIVMRLDDLKNRAGQSDDPAAIDQLRAEIADLRHELDTQAQQFKHERSELRREIDQLRVSGGGEIDEEPVTVLSGEDKRQQALRDKMKGMKKQFGVL